MSINLQKIGKEVQVKSGLSAPVRIKKVGNESLNKAKIS
jgi:hypothetical protein